MDFRLWVVGGRRVVVGLWVMALVVSDQLWVASKCVWWWAYGGVGLVNGVLCVCVCVCVCVCWLNMVFCGGMLGE